MAATKHSRDAAQRNPVSLRRGAIPGASLTVRIEESQAWGGTLIFVAGGTKAQLIEAGLCTPAHFPEGRKRCSGQHHSENWWNMTYRGGGHWTFRRSVTGAERDEWVRAREASRILAGLPKSADEWRNGLLRGWLATVECVRQGARGGDAADGGYALSSEAVEELEDLLREVGDCLRYRAVTFDPNQRKTIEATLRYGE